MPRNARTGSPVPPPGGPQPPSGVPQQPPSPQQPWPQQPAAQPGVYPQQQPAPQQPWPPQPGAYQRQPQPGAPASQQAGPAVPPPSGPGVSPAPGSATGPSLRKPRPAHRRVLIAVVSCVAVVLVAVVLVFTMGVGDGYVALGGSSANAKGFSYSDNLSPDNYALQDPALDLEPDHEFQLPLDEGVDLGYESGAAAGSSAAAAGAATQSAAGTAVPTVPARVFVDGALTQEFPTTLEEGTDGSGKPVLTVSPQLTHAVTEVSDIANLGDEDIFHSGELNGGDKSYTSRWYGFGGYYLVRYVGSDGKPLDKPEVTYFTVKHDVTAEENRLASPQNVQYGVADNGGLSVSWEPVDGARKYKVYMSVVDPTQASSKDAITYVLLAETKDTSVNTLDYDSQTQESLPRGDRDDGELSQYLTDAQASVTRQNSQFQNLVIGETEDDIFYNRWQEQRGIRGLNVADYAPTRDKVKSVAVTVVVVGSADQQSPFEFKNINSLLSQIPLEKASNVQKVWSEQAPAEDADPAGSLGRRMITYVIMADGSSKPAARVIDTSRMTSSQQSVTTGDSSDRSTWETHTYTQLSIPYTVEGTLLQGNINVDQKNFPGGADQIDRMASEQLQALAAANPATGLPQPSAVTPDIDWNAVQASQQPATTMADVPYPVHGSSDYVKYVASNIMAGNMLIDVTDYASQAGAPSFEDVLEEAVTQNPMTLLYADRLSTNVQEKDGRTVVSIYDPGDETNNDTQTMSDRRAKVYEQVKQIVAESVTDGMSDADKVRAINDALCRRLSYNKDSIANRAATGYTGYSAVELVEDNKVICMGYANIFQACMDEAGVTGIVVTGTVPPTPGSTNNGHAWNLVSIDGFWKVVDVTWDDPDDNSAVGEDYLLLDMGDDKLSGRSYDSYWMVDSQLASYIDPSLMMAY